MRTRKKSWAKHELISNPRIIRNPSEYAYKLSEYFNNNNPIHIEIGCGKGRFITEISKLEPNINFFAIERDNIILAAAARLAEQECTNNVAFIEFDADNILDLFLPGEIKRLYLNFSDPWQRKKKRAKRRLTHSNYLLKYEKLKIPEIFFKTDNRILFEFSIESFSENGWKLKDISLDLHKSDYENIMTEYEQKFSSQGLPIYRLVAYSLPINTTVISSPLPFCDV